MENAVSRTSRRRALLAVYLVVMLMVAEDCQCDPGPDGGWRVTSQVATSPVRL